MSVNFDPRAEKDVAAAIEWYDDRDPKVGDTFLERLTEVVDHIAGHPAMYSSVSKEIRRALMRQFPYALYYMVEVDTIRVIAVLHTSRRPDYWQG